MNLDLIWKLMNYFGKQINQMKIKLEKSKKKNQASENTIFFFGVQNAVENYPQKTNRWVLRRGCYVCGKTN